METRDKYLKRTALTTCLCAIASTSTAFAQANNPPAPANTPSTNMTQPSQPQNGTIAPLLNPNNIGQPEPPGPGEPGPTPPTPAPPSTPSITLDTANDMVGIAQQTAASKGLQARIMWIDAGANVGNLNSPEKIDDIVSRIKKAGFNMIVLDVKPIVGDVIYPSKFAPKLTAWKGQTCPPALDVLRHVLDAAHAAGITVYANMATFGEGHKMVKRGLGYQKPDWQTTMYLSNRSVSSAGTSYPMEKIDVVPKSDKTIGIVTKQSSIPDSADITVAVLNLDARVVTVYKPQAQILGQPEPGTQTPPQEPSTANSTTPEESLPPEEIPPGGYALVGRGAAGEWLAAHARIGQIMLFHADPDFVRIADDDSGDQVYTIFVDPDNPEVRKHELDIVREIVTNYDVDGMIFDDRMRWAGINGGFGPSSRAAFEKVVGHKLVWPDDIYRDAAFPGQSPKYGPYFQQWLEWRAGVIHSWLKDASSTVRSIRPGATVSVYVGSWYGDYYQNGSNWASPDFKGPWSWDTDTYRQTAYGADLDWLTTGCYYDYPTIADANTVGVSAGQSVEAAGQISNRVIYDSAWVYAGIYALSYEHHQDVFENALKAAAGSSQGVMIFDMSQIVQYDWWDAIADAFGPGPVPVAPNTVPGLLDTVRAQHAADIAAGKPQPPIPAYQGLQDIGL